MKKKNKLITILSVSALLSIGASATALAADGWVEENGIWAYYNSDGERASEAWKKSGDYWFWLDSNGEMATDTLVENDDDYYYVDSNGALVANQWVAIENEDAGDEDEPEHYWYYFQADGKAYKRSDSASDESVSAKTINGKKYSFDDEGRMLYGWVTGGERETGEDAWKNADYYFGDADDGAMSIGWKLISIVDDEFEDAQPGDEYWDEDQDRWFYFQTTGKKVKADEDDDEVLEIKTINGSKYGFDINGRMVSSWFTEATPSIASQSTAAYSSSFMYFSSPDDGARYTDGWFKVVPGYYLEEDKYDDGSDYWYYADGNGNLYANTIKSINGKKYAFNENGRMIDGLVFLEMDGSSDILSVIDAEDTYDTEEAFDEYVTEIAASEISEGTIRCYYFGSADDGALKTGDKDVEIDGEDFDFSFKESGSTKGSGIVGEHDHKLYNAGKLIKADSYDKYKVAAYNEATGLTVIMDTEDFLDQATDKEYIEDDDEIIWTFDNENDLDDDEQILYYLVNTSGSMIKDKSNAKDGDDYQFQVKNYLITSVTLKD